MTTRLLFLFSLMLGLIPSAHADQVKFVTTGTAGSQHGSDVPAVSDPLQGKPVDTKSDLGPANTQQPYTDDCKEDRCVRAEKRQLGPTTWQEDRASGLHKSAPSSGTDNSGTEPPPAK